MLLLTGVATSALAAALVAFSLVGSSQGESKPAAQIVGAQDTATLLAGIPQRGMVLGRANAPVTLVEYADMQCPYCARFNVDSFPALVRDYVRPGRVRVVFRGLAFVGPDSSTALDTVLAAGNQRRLWNVVELLYHNQGAENSGWVTESLLRSVGTAAGLRVDTMLADRSSARVADARRAAQSAAQADGVTGTPSFSLGRTGGSIRPLRLGASMDGIRTEIDRLLRS